MPFNVYINDQPVCDRTNHFICVNNIVLTAQRPTFKMIENSLTKTLEELTRYYFTNRLKPNLTKTQVCTFRDASTKPRCEKKIYDPMEQRRPGTL